jgi:hypothetical protein
MTLKLLYNGKPAHAVQCYSCGNGHVFPSPHPNDDYFVSGGATGAAPVINLGEKTIHITAAAERLSAAARRYWQRSYRDSSCHRCNIGFAAYAAKTAAPVAQELEELFEATPNIDF